ncbi:hypothetical protein H6G00_26010 [Leptolyngbya sp. FACHB-541]|uniref:hypothetical protein n=1 Tax=Leptolyngbya sp. FACHB-541 TaxID=2692810 RepID=UPI0016882179|nr:hypothetical protein [Leptolyngbya sp. FACHB-541]MBD2000025.1 hypothetical protein [Leptolyngbya sp. FACHB-541]
MTDNLLFDFDRFDNADPRILTLIVIGTEENVRAHILRQHTLGAAEAGLWSKPLPLSQCPGKVISILSRVLA